MKNEPHLMAYSLKNIAVAIDFSDSSLQALQTAAWLAQKHKAQLQLLYVKEAEKISSLVADEDSSQKTGVVHALRQAIFHQFDVEPGLAELFGTPSSEIIKWTNQHPCDLLLMGSHGWSGSRECHIGTNAYQVLKYSACPVLLIPATAKPLAFEKILIALKPLAGTMHLFKMVRDIFNPEASVELLQHSYGRQVHHKQFSATYMQELLFEIDNGRGYDPFLHNQEEDIAAETIEAAQEKKADVLVLAPSLGRLSKIGYVDPEVQKLVNQANMPVLYLMNSSFFRTDQR